MQHRTIKINVKVATVHTTYIIYNIYSRTQVQLCVCTAYHACSETGLAPKHD